MVGAGGQYDATIVGGIRTGERRAAALGLTSGTMDRLGLRSASSSGEPPSGEPLRGQHGGTGQAQH